MKFFIVIFFNVLSALSNLSFSQDYFSFNKGGTNARNYFVSIDFEAIVHFLILEGTIEGRKYRFLFDTGASCMVSRRLFDELNFPILEKTPVYDSNNLADTMKVVSISHIVLDGIEFNDIPAIVNNNDNSIIFDCLEIDGVIGSNLLRNSIVQISSKDQVIHITDNPKKLNLNTKYSSPIFLTPNQSSPYLSISIFEKRKRKVSVLFDSGFNGLFSLSLRHFNDLNKRLQPFEIVATGVGNNSTGLHGHGSDNAIFRLKSSNFLINQSNFANIHYETTRSNNSKIGVGLIDYGIVTLDFINKEFYFEPFLFDNHDLNENHFPFTPAPKDDKLVIGVIWADEIKGKINVGDQILAINNTNFEGMTICEILKQYPSFQEKDEMTITLKSEEGLIKTFTLKKK